MFPDRINEMFEILISSVLIVYRCFMKQIIRKGICRNLGRINVWSETLIWLYLQPELIMAA